MRSNDKDSREPPYNPYGGSSHSRESLAARTRRLLQQYDMRASKRFGQNFLIDENILRKIVAAAELQPRDRVLEIGPGLGGLTLELLSRVERLAVVELDRNMAEMLRRELGGEPNLAIIEGDILRVDWEEIWRREFDGLPAKVLGNIPYNISTPILLKIVEYHRLVSCAVLMLQREVADRLLAGPGSREYGALTVAISYRARLRRVAVVSPGSFQPPPRVQSAIVRLEMLEEPAVTVRDEEFFFKVVRGAFQQRRKVLANSLADNLDLPKEKIARAMETAGIPPKARPEDLSIEEFGRLSEALLDM